MREKAVILDEVSMERALTRIAHEIVEANKGTESLVLIGIQRRGVVLANRLAEILEKSQEVKIATGILDITLYRDDLSLLNEQPVINGTDVGFVLTDKKIVLIDDVLYTGRTIHAAINAIMDMGRPKKIYLAVMIDRGHKEMPFRADFVGKNVPTSSDEIIKVKVTEFDGCNEVVIIDSKGEE
ncbi:MAG: bifunctional pyr operon transcriptional regulator/uracil phosphoribosyltransferase PyrR [Clostridia bacterium]